MLRAYSQFSTWFFSCHSHSTYSEWTMLPIRVYFHKVFIRPRPNTSDWKAKKFQPVHENVKKIIKLIKVTRKMSAWDWLHLETIVSSFNSVSVLALFILVATFIPSTPHVVYIVQRKFWFYEALPHVPPLAVFKLGTSPSSWYSSSCSRLSISSLCTSSLYLQPSFEVVFEQWEGRFLGNIIGWDPSVCKSNQFRVDNLWFSFFKLGYIL